MSRLSTIILALIAFLAVVSVRFLIARTIERTPKDTDLTGREHLGDPSGHQEAQVGKTIPGRDLGSALALQALGMSVTSKPEKKPLELAGELGLLSISDGDSSARIRELMSAFFSQMVPLRTVGCRQLMEHQSRLSCTFSCTLTADGIIATLTGINSVQGKGLSQEALTCLRNALAGRFSIQVDSTLLNAVGPGFHFDYDWSLAF